MLKFRYPYRVEIEKNDDGSDLFFLPCPLVAEPVAYGSTLEEAREDLKGLLLFTAAEYRKDGRLFPIPKEEDALEDCIELSICQSMKIVLLNAMTASGTKPIDIAKKLGIPRQRLTVLLNPARPSRLDTVLEAIQATGKSLTFSVA